MVWAAILFSVIDVFLAVFLVLIGAHGGEEVQILAPFVLIASVAATWIAWAVLRHRSRLMAWTWFLVVAVASAALAPATLFGTIAYGDYQEHRRVRRFSIRDVVDEPILAPDGHPIGVRLKFHFMTPDGYFGVPRPELRTDDNRFFFHFIDRETKVDGVDSGPYSFLFEPGRTYALDFEMKPNSGCCRQEERPCAAAVPPNPLWMQITTSLGDSFYRERTRGSYSSAEMLRDVTLCP